MVATMALGEPLRMDKKPSAGEGSSDESIGRPKEWREGRYQRAGTPVDQAVNSPDKSDESDKSDEATSIESTPVTRKDYEQD
jgi:hypothetical protein